MKLGIDSKKTRKKEKEKKERAYAGLEIKREEERAEEKGSDWREHAELAKRVPGDAYHSYLDKCIKTTLYPPLLAISN